MNIRPRSTRRFAAFASLSALALVAVPASAGAAAEGDVDVVNTETVQVYTDATGKVQSKRVYEQLTLTGDGSVDLVNPIETDGLRNLDEFGGFDVKDGQQIYETSVDGSKALRTVSNYDGDLPLEVEVAYILDGETVDPEDVVGEDGELEVRYTVRNVTAQPQEISFPDGSGGTVTKTVEVPIPLVGSLTTNPPANFTEVQSEGANMAGDGKGGTKLSFTMTLFPPIGTDTAEFGYTAQITDGVVPQTDISVLPVNPMNVPTFKNAANSYQGGADTGARLAAGAGTIDENLLKLRDGAGELLAGLLKLQAGSEQLTAGLAGEAAPGSRLLADGAARLDNGMTQLEDGTGELSAGAVRLQDGAGKVADGAGKVADGAGKAADGANRLADGAGQLDDGLGQLGDGVGDLSTGADTLAAGQRSLADGLKLLYEGVDALPESVKAQLQGNADYLKLLGALQAMADAVDTRFLPGLQGVEDNLRTRLGQVSGIGGLLLAAASTDSTADARTALTNLAALTGCAAPGADPRPAPTTQVCGLIYGIYDGLVSGESSSDTQLTAAGGNLQAISSGLIAGLFDNPDAAFRQLRLGLSSGVNPVTCATAPANCGIKEAALFIKTYGIPTLVNNILAGIEQQLLSKIGQPTEGCDPTETLRCGAEALAAGGGELTAGIDKLVAGVTKLSAGGSLLSTGAGELSDGLGQLDDGAGLLADGAGQLSDGTGELVAGTRKLDDGAVQLKDGSGQLADGAEELAIGLGTAADGSQQITDGMGQAADGAPKLVDGAQRLSDEGTKQLVKAGEDTAKEYGELYATIAAGAERADADGMAYGAPEGAMGLTAYSFVVQGEDGEGSKNLVRGLTGLVLLGAGAGAFALRRRFI